MTSSQFDPSSTSKILNLCLLRFNKQSGSENLDSNTKDLCFGKISEEFQNVLGAWRAKILV